MSEDTIKRSDAIKALRKLGHEVVIIDKVCSLGVATEFIDAIRAIPSADRPQGEWIPCSERLPEKEKETYLICTEGGYMCSCRWTNDMYGLGSNEWSEWGWHIMDKPQYAKVVAWMEMEPWKGADDDNA